MEEMVLEAKVVGDKFPEIRLILNPDIKYPRGFLQQMTEAMQDHLNARYLVNKTEADLGGAGALRESIKSRMIQATSEILQAKRASKSGEYA